MKAYNDSWFVMMCVDEVHSKYQNYVVSIYSAIHELLVLLM